MKQLLTFTLLLSIAGAAPAQNGQTGTGTATYAYDGDNVRVKPDGGGRTLAFRMSYLDAPEIAGFFITKTQPHAYTSRDSVRLLVVGQRVRYEIYPGRDIHERRVGSLWFESTGARVDSTLLAYGLVFYVPLRSGTKVPAGSKLKNGAAISKMAYKAHRGIWWDGKDHLTAAEWRKRYRYVAPNKTRQ